MSNNGYELPSHEMLVMCIVIENKKLKNDLARTGQGLVLWGEGGH